MAARARTRAAVTPEALSDALLPVASSKNFVQYNESALVVDSKLDTKLISKHHDVLSAFHSVDPKLTFKKSTLKAAMQIIWRSRHQEWKLEAKHGKSWTEVMSIKCANILRNVGQGMLKSPKAAWVKSLPFVAASAGASVATTSTTKAPNATTAVATGIDEVGDADLEGESNEEGGEEEQAEIDEVTEAEKEEEPKDKKTKVEIEYVYGWDAVNQTAWRMNSAMKKPAKEPSVKLYKQDGAQAHDCIWASWADGDPHEVREITCEEYTIMEQGRQGSKDVLETIWDGEHVATHHRLYIKARHDRKMLCSLYEQGKQICQVIVSMWGPEDDPNSLKEASKMMIELAQLYEKDLIKKSDFKEKKKDLLAKNLPPRSALQRPAAAIKTEKVAEPPAKKNKISFAKSVAEPFLKPALKFKPRAPATISAPELTSAASSSSAPTFFRRAPPSVSPLEEAEHFVQIPF